MNVVKFRPYKVRRISNNEFVTTKTTFNKDFAREDLARSGLIADDVNIYDLDNLQLDFGAQGGYFIPYYTLEGDILRDSENYATMYRLKLKHPPLSKLPRYSQPTKEELATKDLPGSIPYLYPCDELGGEIIYCCEGEKKTASFVKHTGRPAFGIGGCTMWTNPAGVGGVHPWILTYLRARQCKRVVIIPDGDIFKYDICKAYGTFAVALRKENFEVELLIPPGKIDDLAVQYGTELPAKIDAFPKLAPEQLVQAAGQLIAEYGLSFDTNGKGRHVVHQNSSNVTRLLEAHPAFREIWRNADNNTIFIGDEALKPDYHDLDIANHFQHNLSMPKVSRMLVVECIRGLARKNERSPMLEWVKAQIWDGVPRLSNWMNTHWGIEQTTFVAQISAKWLISACARMDNPGCKVDWMLIVIGPQGTGKTSMPNIMFRGNSALINGDSNSKDFRMLLHSALVTSFDELDSFNRREASELKSIITSSVDTFRPPYGTTTENFPRRSTLYGSGNRSDFLQGDISGQRRYAIVECQKLLDFKGLETALPQLWAEAWHRYTQGGINWWDADGASALAKNFEQPNIWTEKVLSAIDAQLFAKQSSANKADFMFSIPELMNWMDVQYNSNSTTVRDIASALINSGYAKKKVRINGNPRERWYRIAPVV